MPAPQPRSTANAGIRKVTEIAFAKPTCAIGLKYSRYATPVQKTASSAVVTPAWAGGAALGHHIAAGTASASTAPSWLPAAAASSATPLRNFVVKLAERP